jgi:hypothetical protein
VLEGENKTSYRVEGDEQSFGAGGKVWRGRFLSTGNMS